MYKIQNLSNLPPNAAQWRMKTACFNHSNECIGYYEASYPILDKSWREVRDQHECEAMEWLADTYYCDTVTT